MLSSLTREVPLADSSTLAAAPLLRFAASAFFLLTQTAAAADWPQWRGLNRDGASTEKGWLTHWPDEGPRTLWKAEVGSGFSSFAIVSGHLFTMGFVGENDPGGKPKLAPDGLRMGSDIVWCMDANTGAVLWKCAYPSLGDATYSTPAVYDGRVYTQSRIGQLYCLDAATGRIIWNRDFRRKPIHYDYGCSPIVMGDVVIVDGGGKEAMAFGLDRKTGQVAWKWGKEDLGFSSPAACESGGKPGVVFVSFTTIVCLDPANGQEQWRYPAKEMKGMNSFATPIVNGDKIFVNGTHTRMALLLQLPGAAPPPAPSGPKVLWQNKDLDNYFQSSVVVDGYVYGLHAIDDQTFHTLLRCLRADTGQVLWEQGGFAQAAMIAADGKLIILGERGELMVVEASPAGYKQLARAQVFGGKTWVSPVLWEGKIYCRNNAGTLICLDVKG